MKKIIALMIMISASLNAYCLFKPCDPSIVYAMSKQRGSLNHRLNDLIGALKKNNEATRDQTLIITYEIKAYTRLRERLKAEYIMLDHAAFFSGKSKDVSDLLQRLNLINDNKESDNE